MTKISHINVVRYKVIVKKKIKRMAEKMPARIRNRFAILIEDLQENGAIRKN